MPWRLQWKRLDICASVTDFNFHPQSSAGQQSFHEYDSLTEEKKLHRYFSYHDYWRAKCSRLPASISKRWVFGKPTALLRRSVREQTTSDWLDNHLIKQEFGANTLLDIGCLTTDGSMTTSSSFIVCLCRLQTIWKIERLCACAWVLRLCWLLRCYSVLRLNGWCAMQSDSIRPTISFILLVAYVEYAHVNATTRTICNSITVAIISYLCTALSSTRHLTFSIVQCWMEFVCKSKWILLNFYYIYCNRRDHR